MLSTCQRSRFWGKAGGQRFPSEFPGGLRAPLRPEGERPPRAPGPGSSAEAGGRRGGAGDPELRPRQAPSFGSTLPRNHGRRGTRGLPRTRWDP